MKNISRRVARFFAGAVVFLSLGTAFAQETTFGGSLAAQVGTGFLGDNKGSLLTAETVFDGMIKSYFDENYLYVNASVTFDALGALSESERTQFVAGDGKIALRLKEAYFDYAGEQFALRIGRQIAAWGKADEIQVADVLCPKDESVLIASDYADSRLGIDTVRLSYTGNAVQVDAYWIPVFTPSTIPLADGNPLRKVAFGDDFDAEDISLNTPKLRLYNGEYAARFAAFFPFADFSFYGFYGWEDSPFMRYSVDVDDGGTPSINVAGEYERMLMFGADAAIPINPITLRLEAAVYPQRHLQASDAYQKAKLTAGEKNEWTLRRTETIGLIGCDWSPSGGWTITAQYWADFVAGNLDDLERENAYDHQATLSVEKTFLGETLTLSGNVALDLRHFSTASEVSAEYKLSDAITLSAIADFFCKGKEDGMYGEYKDLSCFTIKGKYSF